ncbi:ROK family protein [Cytobacillus sp. FJAT-54145]|uniref:ROK family protein n=1 Tax=Cytobacillus spartinae TaxID=3299023 RepID=A0ABW6KHU1_9BACI
MKYLAIDIGGTFIKYALMDQNTNILERGSVKTPYEGIEALIEAIGYLYDKYEQQIVGMPISMPGIIDSKNGIALTGGALTYISNLNIKELLHKRCPTNISIENDGKCAALAETWKGSLKDCDDGIVIVLGTGIGGGIIKDRKVHKGKNFFAGEFSFIGTNIDAFFDSKYRWALQNGASTLNKEVAQAKNMDVNELDGVKIFEMANNGDGEVLEVLNRFTQRIATQIYNLQCIYDPEKIAIGGGISAQDLLIDLIKKNLNKIYVHFNEDIPRAEVVRCEFLNDSNLIGATYNLITSEK